MGILTSEEGRLRLGWRILLFLVLTASFTLAASLAPFDALPLQTVPVLVGSLAAGWLLLALDHRAPGALGFHLHPEAVGDVVGGVGLGAGAAILVLALMFLTGGLRWAGDDGGFLPYLTFAGTSLLFFSLPAAAEEALMRGYLFQALGEVWGGGVALWVTSVIFALLHLGNPNLSWLGMTNLLMAGLFLGVIYLKTASLWWATAAHVGWNWALGSLGDLPVSGLELLDAPMLEGVVRGPGWLTGGSFGPEASVLATAVLGLATLFLWKSPLFSPGDGIRELKPLILSGPGREPGSMGAGESSRIGESWRTT